MQFQLLGWGPDLDPLTPGVMVDAYRTVSTPAGYKLLSSFDPVETIGSIYPAGLAVGAVGDNIHAVVAGYANATSTTVATLTYYEIRGAGNVTAVGSCTAGTYTVPVALRQFDSEMFAARKDHPLRAAAYNGNFTAVTGAPSCSLIETTRDFVIAFDTSAGFDWHCSAIGDGHNWTLSVSNQCVRGKFYDKSGRIIASGRVGENVFAFTKTQTWIGRYVGAPDVWQWEPVSRYIGCVSPQGAVQTPHGLCFIGQDDIYITSGDVPVPLQTTPVRNYLFSTLWNSGLVSYAAMGYDAVADALLISAPAAASTLPNSTRATAYYAFRTKQWTYIDGGFNAYNQLQTPEYQFSLSAPARDGLAVSALKTGSPGVFNTAMSGPPNASGTGLIVTGFIGDPSQVTMLRSIRPRYGARTATNFGLTVVSYSKAPSTADNVGTATTSTLSRIDSDGKMPLRVSGRYHQIQFRIQPGDLVTGFDLDLVPMGTR